MKDFRNKFPEQNPFMQDEVDLAVHGLSAGDRFLQLFASGIAALILLICLVPLITPRNYKTNMSSEISPAVQSSSAWYGNSFNTVPRIALGIAALAILLSLAAQSLGVEYSNIPNTSILIAVGIVGFLLLFYLVPLIAHFKHKTNMSSQISPVVQSSSVEHGNKRPLPSGKYYTIQVPFESVELASRCPRPRMIARA